MGLLNFPSLWYNWNKFSYGRLKVEVGTVVTIEVLIGMQFFPSSNHLADVPEGRRWALSCWRILSPHRGKQTWNSKSMSGGGNLLLRSTEPVFEFPIYPSCHGVLWSLFNIWNQSSGVGGKNQDPLQDLDLRGQAQSHDSLMFSPLAPTYSGCWNERWLTTPQKSMAFPFPSHGSEKIIQGGLHYYGFWISVDFMSLHFFENIYFHRCHVFLTSYCAFQTWKLNHVFLLRL